MLRFTRARRRATPWILLVLACAFLAPARAAERGWLKLQAPSFGVISQLDEKDTLAWAAEFEQLRLVATPRAPETVLHGWIEDQSALHGVLRRIEALGLDLVEVRQVHADRSAPAGGTTG